jgi:BirA family transcriptional regulator, biotin operon repressor / biotin---[acetyl-CoA-carboxylase] ligase
VSGAARADARVIGRVIHALDEVGSTQAEVARLAAAGAREGVVVTARHQRAGRGRLGRAWWDEAGESLLVSVLLRPPVATTRVPQLALVGGVAVVDAVTVETGLAPGLRWPNDVMVGERKICGVLAEAATARNGAVDRVILGIGLNVNQASFPPEVAPRASSLRLLTGRVHDRDRLFAALLDALDARYRAFLAESDDLRAAWRRHSLTLGARVRTADGREGVAVDLDETGALLIRAGDGALLRVVSGEIAGAPAA